jgi:hypothetical protein
MHQLEHQGQSYLERQSKARKGGRLMAEDTTNTQTLPSNPALARLSAFVGSWQWEASLEGKPIGRGSTTFAWQEGGAFLVEHAGAEQPEFPSTTAMIGADDTADMYSMLYYDSRGIARIYQMTLRDGVWRQWRDAPGFSQRFEGTFSDDGKKITGRWEKSADGAQWELDFDLTYTKVD